MAAVKRVAGLVSGSRQRRGPVDSVAAGRGDGAGELSDAMLLAGFAVGDSRASLLFVRRFERVVIGVAMAVVHDQGLAEDVGQQAFVRAWSHADLYDPCRGSVRTWMTTIVRNLAVDMMRVRRPYPLSSDELEPLLAAMTSTRTSTQTSAVTSTPEAHALDGEASGVLGRALAALPPEQARAVVLASVHGCSASQVAELESIPLGTAKSRVRGGLIKLREAVVASGGRQR